MASSDQPRELCDRLASMAVCNGAGRARMLAGHQVAFGADGDVRISLSSMGRSHAVPAPELKQLDLAADDLAGALISAPSGIDALWQINGAPTVGKSSCLRLLNERLMQGGALKPMLVSPPPHRLDTGPAALADVAVGLAHHGYLNGELEAWSAGGATWNERLGQVRRCISKHDDVVILCDEPSAWGANRGGDDFFARRSEYVALFLESLPCRRVVIGKLPVPVSPS